MSEKDQKITVADLDIGLNPFTRFVLQSLQGSVYFHDPIEDKNLFTSEKILERTGYSKEDILAMDDGFRSIVHPDDLEGVFEMNKNVLSLKDGDFSEATYRIKKKDGEWVWHRSEEYVYRRNEKGRPSIIFGVAHDLTQLKEKEVELQKLADHNAFLVEISQLITFGQGDMKTTLQALSERVARQFQVVCTIFFHDEKDNSIQPGAVYYQDKELVDILTGLFNKTTVKVGDGMVGKVIRDGKEFVISETDENLRKRTAAVDPRLESVGLAYLPIKGLSKIVGAISLVQLVEFKPFSKHEWEAIAQVVRNVSLFVEHSIITNERKEELERLAKAESELLAINRSNAFQLELSKIVSDLSSKKPKTLHALAKVISIQFDAVCDIHLIEEDETLEPVAWYHPKKEIREKVGKMFELGRFKVGQGILGGVAKDSKEFIKQVLPKDFYDSKSQMDPELRACSFMYLPISGYDSVIGTFGLTRLVGQPTFTDGELEQVRQAVTTVSQFLDNRLLFEARAIELKKRTEAEYHLTELDKFNKFQLGVSQSLSDLDSEMTEVLQGLAESITTQFDVGCNIHMVDQVEKVFKPLAVSHKSQALAKKIYGFFSDKKFPWNYGMIGKVLQSGKMLRIKKVGNSDRVRFNTEDELLVPGSLLYLPIKGREGTIGILDISREKGADKISDVEVDQLLEVGSNISLFINNHIVFDQKQAELEKRKQAEAALIDQNAQIEQAEQEMRGMLDTMPILVARIDKDKRFRFANKAYANLLKLEQNWIVGKHLSEIIGKNEYKSIDGFYENVLKGNTEIYSNNPVLPDGSTRCFDVVNSPDYGKEGEIIGVLSCVVDVTDKAQAEKELESSEEQLQLIFDNVESFISTFNKEGKIISINRTSQGLTKEDVIGKSIPDFFPDTRLKAEISQKLPLLIHEGKPFDIEHSFIGADGSTLNHHNRYLGVFEDGQFSTGIIITSDVTAKREKERAEMGAMIKGQEIERKRVAADMHDGVGQILSAISIQLSQLKSKKEQASVADLESLSDKVQYGIVEVRNVSHALKPDVLEHFGLVPAIEEVCSTLSSDIGPSISFNHIDVERRFPEDVEINVYRIVQELLNNCIKHAQAKDVFVTLIKYKDTLLLTVEDDGGGMANIDHTGIGLNNVKLRSDIINGEMNIDSSLGKGSLINIEVPI
ncbi:MAG: PAS domain S-box-containing protein [Granulosicoccus sp.]